MTAFRDDLDRAADWVDAYLAGVGERSRLRAGRARCGARPPADGTAGAGRVVRDDAARPRRADRARALALEPPSLLCVVREHRLRAGRPRRAAGGGVERERDDVGGVACRHGARGGDAVLARTAPRPSRRLARPHRGHRVDRDGRRAGCRAHAASRRCRVRVGAGELQRREGGPPRRPRVPSGRRRRCVPHADGLPARRRDGRRRDRRHHGNDVRSTRSPSCSGAARPPVCGCTSMPRTPARRPSVPELRWCLAGCERADSLVVNPHKWLFTPMDCSALWTRRPDVFRATFGVVRDYLADTESAVDLKDYGPALGRRFRALKLWFVLRWYGAEGLRALIREHVRLAQLFASWVDADPGLGGLGAASVLGRLLSPPNRRQRCDRARCNGHRQALRRTGAAAWRVDHPACDRQRAHHGGGHRDRVGGASRIRPRAVIFDLWETLIDWDREAAAAMVAAVSEHAPDFVERWSHSQNRYTGPIRVALTDAGVPASALEDVCALRLEYVREALVPRAGAVETLRRLRELGVLVGLITVCSEDVEELWPSSAFAGLFDAEVFSSAVGLSKPDPRIYLPLLRAARDRAVRGGVRRRRCERRAGGRGARRDADGPHPPARRSALLGRAGALRRPPGHVDPRGAGGAGAVISAAAASCKATR